MNRFSKIFVGVSTAAVLATGAYAYCNGEGKSCDYKNDAKQSCKMYKDNKHHSMYGMKQERGHGYNSPRHIMKAIDRLDLTPDQREKLAQIKNKYHATIPNLSDAFSKNSLDEKKLNEALNFDIRTIQIKIITQSYGVLNDIQRGYLKEILDNKQKKHPKGDKNHCNMRK